jgi:hypothetical protein
VPARNQRLFWVYAERPSLKNLSRINTANDKFVSCWSGCDVTSHPCSDGKGGTNGLWLFILNSQQERKLASSFNNELKEHIASLVSRLNLKDSDLKRRSNLPTPLIDIPLNSGWRTDFGLHAVNDTYNGMLVTYTYHNGRYMMPPHLQTARFRDLLSEIVPVWRRHSCRCRNTKCSECSGDGCFDCFKEGCKVCDGTGWKEYSKWAKLGYRVDYSSGYPIAIWK